ncbi:MAG: phosphotransferase [Bacteroidetes bacterium]|nr:phosphotransferase [Bacteroidota bacterium]
MELIDHTIFQSVIKSFINTKPDATIEVTALENGHINSTYKVDIKSKKFNDAFMLQRINTKIFKNPEVLITSMRAVENHLKLKNYPKQIIVPKINNKGVYLTYDVNGFAWRSLPYINESISLEKAESPTIAFIAAKTFSEFYSYLWDFDLKKIKPSIPNFLNFEHRIKSFNDALQNADNDRKEAASDAIKFCKNFYSNVENFFYLQKNKLLPIRLIHADPKISNILFNKSKTKTKAVIDLDTLMAGTILYDFGDMVRSYTNNRLEDDPREKNIFNIETFNAVKEGFLFHLKKKLEKIELDNLKLAAETVIFIQAIRFLTDYLKGDVYYKIKYPHQNLNRTKNQINLLKMLHKINQ